MLYYLEYFKEITKVINQLVLQTQFQQLIPKVINVIRAMVPVDDHNTVQAMDLFDVLAECEVSSIVISMNLVMNKVSQSLREIIQHFSYREVIN